MTARWNGNNDYLGEACLIPPSNGIFDLAEAQRLKLKSPRQHCKSMIPRNLQGSVYGRVLVELRKKSPSSRDSGDSDRQIDHERRHWYFSVQSAGSAAS